jgi:hypothetical protein
MGDLGFANAEKKRVAPGLLTVFATLSAPAVAPTVSMYNYCCFLQLPLENVPCFNAPKDEPMKELAQ